MIDYTRERLAPAVTDLPDGDEWTPLNSADVIEIPLLLSGQQMHALEEAAHHRGLTAGEMVRHLLHDFITRAVACKVV